MNNLRLFQQIIKFGVVGFLAFCVDYGILYLLTDIFGCNYLLSSAISFSVSTVFNYTFSMKFVFVSKDNVNKFAEFSTFVLLSLTGVGITVLLMYIFVDCINVHYLIAKIVVTSIVMFYNFITRKLFLEKR